MQKKYFCPEENTRPLIYDFATINTQFFY